MTSGPRRTPMFLLAVVIAMGAQGCGASRPVPTAPTRDRVIVFVWDGLRPDSINPRDTPNLERLRGHGVEFSDHHATYPTFTMMNSAAFATGAFPATTGFYGNWVWVPDATGRDYAGKTVDFRQPVFTEDYAILRDLDTFYGGQLLLVETLFQAAQRAKLTTAAVGKAGAAFLQDHKRGGFIIDEHLVWPLSLAWQIQASGGALPRTTPVAYEAGAVTLDASNGDPMAVGERRYLEDGVTSDPSPAANPPPLFTNRNTYLLQAYLDHVLPRKPDLTLIWLRSPDTNQHIYGPGSPAYVEGLRSQDALLGALQDRLERLGLTATTDILVVSDHGHSTVSGPPSLFPLRAVHGGAVTVGALSSSDTDGYSVSGDVRLADLLTLAGFTALDGNDCQRSPVLSGIKADGSTVYGKPLQRDVDGTSCVTAGAAYTTRSYRVGNTLAPKTIVVAANGGSEYLYVTDHDPATVASVVRFLQEREEFGAIFVGGRYGAMPGTLPLAAVKAENAAGRNPDVIASYAFDETVTVNGFKGITFESMQNNRGMHGSFSPIDVHNTLVASGPAFRSAFKDALPSGNVDVAPTVAMILGVELKAAEGRPLLEALREGGADASSYTVAERDEKPVTAATGLSFRLPTSPSGADRDTALAGTYSSQLHEKVLTRGDRSYVYFDFARAIRN